MIKKYFNTVVDALLRKLGCISKRQVLAMLRFSRGQRDQALGRKRLTVHYLPLQSTSDDAFRDVVPAGRMGFSHTIVKRVQSELFEGMPFPPNKAQQALILSDARNVIVSAGAGSGKSTSLHQKIYVMHKYLKIPLEEITVFSFTRASCEDFRIKLIRFFASQGEALSRAMADRMVRTFHSKVLEVSKKARLIGKDSPIFEFLDKRPQRDEDVDNVSVLLSEFKSVDSEGKPYVKAPKAFEVVKGIYCRLYKGSASFRKTIDKLEVIAYQQTLVSYNKELKKALNNLDVVQQRDRQLVAQCNDILPIQLEGVEAGRAFQLFIDGVLVELQSNYFYPEKSLHILVCPDKTYLESIGRHEEKVNIPRPFSLFYSGKNKSDLTIRYGDINYRMVKNPDDRFALIRFLKRDYDDNTQGVPMFDLRLTGELRCSICDAFQSTANFIDSLGLRVSDLQPYIDRAPMEDVDRVFMRAFITFWPYFERVLAENGVYRFSQLFAQLADPESPAYEKIGVPPLRSMKHIIIDEFQDISPLEKNWIVATLRFLKRAGQKTSLTCVGDDYQSIYGWKGSSPDYILDYQRYFPAENTDCITMDINYRSFQNVVSIAESTLQDIDNTRKSTKVGRCFRGVGGDGIVFLPVADDDKEACVLEKIIEVEQKLLNMSDEERLNIKDTYLLVLARGNSSLNKVEEKYLRASRLNPKKHIFGKKDLEVIRFETFHRSKGLESEYTILVDDCAYNKTNHIKNMLYALSGKRGVTYDESQIDEAARLAYVALTRAKVTGFWYANPISGEAFEKAHTYKKTHAINIRVTKDENPTLFMQHPVCETTETG